MTSGDNGKISKMSHHDYSLTKSSGPLTTEIRAEWKQAELSRRSFPTLMPDHSAGEVELVLQ